MLNETTVYLLNFLVHLRLFFSTSNNIQFCNYSFFNSYVNNLIAIFVNIIRVICINRLLDSMYECCWLIVWASWHINLSRLFHVKIQFYTNDQFYLKHFSLAWVENLIVKNISISSYSAYLNRANSVQYKYRFCLHTFNYQNSYISNNLV